LVWATAIIVLETPLSAKTSGGPQPLAEKAELRKSGELPQAMRTGGQLLVGEINFGAGRAKFKGYN
jgi:hypothetical protein